MEKLRNGETIKQGITSSFKILLYLLIGLVGFVDYGVKGILTIIIFYIFRNFKFAWIGQLTSLILLYIVFF